MNASAPSEANSFRHTRLLAAGLDQLREFKAATGEVQEALSCISEAGDENTRRRITRLTRQLETFEPSVTMIGQIKSGKTSLVNAFVGQPDLLPADVNPWTSVVTSLHLYPETADFRNSASFRFFDEDEWDRLVSGGGRIGELASRAGADDELEKIKKQVAEMREKSRARLGRKFEVMLGQQRDYGYFDKELIERYVCLGDDSDDDPAVVQDGQGRFADITKSADLHLTRPSLPVRMCIRDTPGVNDTFMMREQITIRAIRDSRICVVVLSAHQALSSADLALIRLITHVRSRDVIIFVNRIDELSDPASEIPMIARSISDTLERHNGPADAEVIFGSALWASAALAGDVSGLPAGSAEALKNRSETAHFPEAAHDLDIKDPASVAWAMSGIPELHDAVAGRIAGSLGMALLQRTSASGLNLATSIRAADQLAVHAQNPEQEVCLDSTAARDQVAAVLKQRKAALSAEFDAITTAFSERMNRVQESFLERATGSLVLHLEKLGEKVPWTYDPAGLRVLLNSSHKVLARKSTVAFDNAVRSAAHDFAAVYQNSFGLHPDEFPLALPNAPRVPPPVSLGRTIALDLQGQWWKRWWLQRRGYDAYATAFTNLIREETDPVVQELRDDIAQDIRRQACADFDAFLSEQESVFYTLDRLRERGEAEIVAFVQNHEASSGKRDVSAALQILGKYSVYE
ncbi:dynamin family protein [Roseobacter sp.]|uniref:dynamin family protein n=1 Tax=Roseobacter sp. TaxID=1907202 RepID=UPI0025DF052A|nr:dynamin family protein [Roseobacter sp.]